jgi:hypothetical protein
MWKTRISNLFWGVSSFVHGEEELVYIKGRLPAMSLLLRSHEEVPRNQAYMDGGWQSCVLPTWSSYFHMVSQTKMPNASPTRHPKEAQFPVGTQTFVPCHEA